MLREGSGEPLVLMHGIICSERVWSNVVPYLTDDFDVIVPNALGHRDGPKATTRPATIEHVIDAAEAQLDELGLDKAHLAGNSMGGWMAFELARRGRALSACGVAPAGFWDESWDEERDRTFDLLSTAVREAHRGRRLGPLLSRSARFRRWALQNACVHGDRVTRAEFLEGGDDVRACEIAEELLVPGFSLAPLEGVDCPLTIAWCEHDVLFPLDPYRPRGEEVVAPDATVIVLEDVGHVPMYDDPKLVADTIRTAARASVAVSSPGS